jgi:hypothetical protein
MAHVARPVPPRRDKHWSFKMVSDSLPTRGEFLVAMGLPAVQVTPPFLQGFDEGRWVMVEFWQGGEELARDAAGSLTEWFATSLLRGDFTRAELGLERD